MTCDRAREWISADLDGEADPLLRDAAHDHVDACAACRRWADQAERVTRLLRADAADAAEVPEPGSDTVDRLIDAVTAGGSRLPSWIPRTPLLTGLAAPGCLCGPDCACVTGRPGLCACGASCSCGVA